jgi:hypothetical protein
MAAERGNLTTWLKYSALFLRLSRSRPSFESRRQELLTKSG